ncbi:transposase [Candidatus Saccharibacteria bacterium]|nr:transposase [Candidatus Saccharibacteria bacterium]|tara:strand:- start:642 stop:1172 length:531 start_codon:yes stop_codon:yes gene_type:complete
MPQSILTDIGLAKITTAAGSGSQVAIAEVAIGDGNGANYNPDYAQTSLVRERARRAIEARSQIEPDKWWIKVEFPPDTIAFNVREVGFFDADGDLIALFAGADVEPRQTGVISYIIDHVLDFGRIDDGLVVVSAPDDALFDHMISNIETHAIIANEQVRQAIAIRELLSAQKDEVA